MQEQDKPRDERARPGDDDDPSFPQPRRPRKQGRIVFHADAADADWIKGDRVRLGDDGAIYVRDLGVAGGTRRVERTDGDWRELADRLNDEERARVLREGER